MDKSERAHPKASRLRLTAADLRLRASSSSHSSLRHILFALADAYDRAAAFLDSRHRRSRGTLQ